MWRYIDNFGKFCLLFALILFGHDILNWLEYGSFYTTSMNKLSQLIFSGEYVPSLKTGSSFFDDVLSWPAFIVFGAVGVAIYILGKGK